MEYFLSDMVVRVCVCALYDIRRYRAVKESDDWGSSLGRLMFKSANGRDELGSLDAERDASDYCTSAQHRPPSAPARPRSGVAGQVQLPPDVIHSGSLSEDGNW